MAKCYDSPAISALYGQLVDDFGGVEAVAAYLRCSKGTVSKEINGTAGVSPAHFAALEDRLGRFPITDMLAARAARTVHQSDLVRLADQVMREAGDLGPALLHFARTGDTDQLRKEGRELSAVLGPLLSAVEGEQDDA